MDYKLLLAMIIMDGATLSQWSQYIILHILQYSGTFYISLVLSYAWWIVYPKTTIQKTRTRKFQAGALTCMPSVQL